MEGGHRKGDLAETVDLPGEKREIFKTERRRIIYVGTGVAVA